MLATQHRFAVGQTVVFGRPNGTKTTGVVVKLNDKSAKIKTTETRNSRPADVTWRVAYSLITPLTGGINVQAEPSPLTWDPNSPDNAILDAMLACYLGLEPENLSCDGELSRAEVAVRRSRLESSLARYRAVLGFSVTESDLYRWDGQRTGFTKRPT